MTKWKAILCALIAWSALSLPVEAGDQTLLAQTSKTLPLPTSASPSMDTAISLPIKYMGNAESHKFHRPSCPFARIMASNKRVPFNYRTQAIACGHIPCRYCLPPVWTVVRGCLLAPVKARKPESELPCGAPGHSALPGHPRPHPPAPATPATPAQIAPVLPADPPVDRAPDPP